MNIRWDSSIEKCDKINLKKIQMILKIQRFLEIIGLTSSNFDKDKIFEYFKKFDYIKNFGF